MKAQLTECLEFQVRVEDGKQWESLIRFFLDGDVTKVVAHQDPGTQAGVVAVLDDIYQESLYIPDDGRRFFNMVAGWKEGTRAARVISRKLTLEQARDVTSLSAAAQVEPEESDVELIGQPQQPAPIHQSDSASLP